MGAGREDDHGHRNQTNGKKGDSRRVSLNRQEDHIVREGFEVARPIARESVRAIPGTLNPLYFFFTYKKKRRCVVSTERNVLF